MIEIRAVRTRGERDLFLTFPWRIYRRDPLWVPPLGSERARAIDPERGLFFQEGCAEFFLAWKESTPTGTLCLAEDRNATQVKGYAECMFGFVKKGID